MNENVYIHFHSFIQVNTLRCWLTTVASIFMANKNFHTKPCVFTAPCSLTVFTKVERLAGGAVSQNLSEFQAQVYDQKPCSGVEQEADEVPVKRSG